MSRDYLYGDAKATAKSGEAGRKERALSAAKLAYEQDPTPQNQAKLASALFEIGKFNEAEKMMTDVLDKISNDLKLLSDLGFTYKNLKQFDKAKEIFLRIVAIDPKHPLARSAENEIWVMDPTYKPSWLRRD
ncbi:tetratricopeptide repeat protein [bacterium]|nr:tetratricopeptide repeat protein [bacterium]